MAEASTRVLLDRTAIRLDGRSFFAFGPRLYLTPREHLATAIADIAYAGFTAVMTPPASPGNLSLLNFLFDHAERSNLLVVVATEPRLPEPATFLAANFRHRPGLHSYCLTTPDNSEQSFLRFCVERDRLRAEDLFHPIWTPWRPGFPFRLWLDSTDLHSVDHYLGGPMLRTDEENGALRLQEIFAECAGRRLAGRPFFCHSLQVCTSDAARERGVFDHDPCVNSVPARKADWHPWLAMLGETPRQDFLPPDPDLIRLRLFELLAARVRGVVADFYEFLLGPAPTTGRDRFCELAVLAQEIAVFREFFAEGQFVRADLETGHPLLSAAMLHHGDDILLLLWRSSEGDEFWIDPARMTRVEVFIGLGTDAELDAWRLDFPGGHPVQILRDAKGDVRLQLDSVDLTAKILLTRSKQRPKDLAERLQERLKPAATFRVEGVQYRMRKVRMIERELRTLGRGQDKAIVEEAESLLRDAADLLESDDLADAWISASQAMQLLRTLINQRMTAAAAAGRGVVKDSREDLLRRSYYTLPQFYQSLIEQDLEAVQDYT